MSGKHFKDSSATPQGKPQSSPNPYGKSAHAQGNYSRAAGYGSSRASKYAAQTPKNDLYSGQNFKPEDTFVGRMDFTQYNSDHYDRLKKKQKKRKHTGLKIFAAILVLVLVAVGGAAAYAYTSIKTVKDDAAQIVSIGEGLIGEVKNGNTSGLADGASQVTEVTEKMKSEINSPLWNFVAQIPYYQDDVAEARQLVDVLDNLCTDALIPACNQLDGLSLGTMLSDGGVNVDTLQAMLNTLNDVANPILEAKTAIDGMSTNSHISQINEAVSKAQKYFSGVDSMLEIAEQVTPYLPQMFGANGQTRHYLIIAEQNSEIRAPGGFPGGQALLTVENGKISLGAIHSAALIDYNGADITDQEFEIFKAGGPINMAYRSGDAYAITDFYRASECVIHMWAEAYGQEEGVAEGDIDGAIAVDPVMIAKLMRLTGGLTLSTGQEITADNAAEFMSKTIYKKYGGDADNLFGEIASHVLSGILHGLGDVEISDFLDVIEEGIEEGRVLCYLVNEKERVLPEILDCTGSLSTDETATPVTAAYLDDYTFGKIGMYLDFQVERGDSIDNGDGSLTYNMKVTLTNNITADEVANDGWYIVGTVQGEKLAYGDIALRLFLYAPAGGSVEIVNTDGFNAFTPFNYLGLDLTRGFVDIPPGETATVEYTVTTSTQSNGQEMAVKATPTVGEAQNMKPVTKETVNERG